MPSLSQDDLPCPISPQDILLRQQLEQSTSHRFFEACGLIIRTLLADCEWQISLKGTVPILLIACPNVATYWRLMNALYPIGKRLQHITGNATIRIYPPNGKGREVEATVDEVVTQEDY